MKHLPLVAVIACAVTFSVAFVARQDAVKPLGTVKDIMHAIVIPASTAVFEAAAEAPKDDEGWGTLRYQAIAVGEAGNLLMLGARAKDAAEWMEKSRAQVDAAEKVIAVIDAKNAAGLEDASNALYETCESCHATYFTGSAVAQ